MDCHTASYENGPDWAYWARVEHLLPKQIASLLLRCDPRSENFSHVQASNEYKDLRRIFYQYDSSRNLIDQGEMYKFCERAGIQIPKEMRQPYEAAHPETTPSIKTLQRQLRVQERKIKELKAEVDYRSINKLMIMFCAMCSGNHYQYDPQKAKNATTAKILDATSALDKEGRISVSENTVREWIGRAKDCFEQELKRVSDKDRRHRRGAERLRSATEV